MTMTARYAGQCAHCRCRIRPGETIEWDRNARKAYCNTCRQNRRGSTTRATSRYYRRPTTRRNFDDDADLYGEGAALRMRGGRNW